MLKRFLAMLLCFCMVITLLPVNVLAAEVGEKASGQIKIQVDVFDVGANKSYQKVGYAYADKRDHMIQSEDFRIPELSDVLQGEYAGKEYGRIQKVTGNWYATYTQGANVGATVNFSNNSSFARMTYYVGWFDTDSGADAGGGTNGGGSGGDQGNPPVKYSWIQTVIYHANFPDGTDYTYTVKYNIKHMTTHFSSPILEIYENCGFTVPAGWELAPDYWNTEKDGSGAKAKGGVKQYSIGFEKNNPELHLYAQYIPKADTLEQVVTLTYHNGDEVFQQADYYEDDIVPITLDKPTTAPAMSRADGEKTFMGWDDTPDATEVVYTAESLEGDSYQHEITMDTDKDLYAVWKDQTEPAPEKPDAGDLSGKVAVVDAGGHDSKQYELFDATAVMPLDGEDGAYTIGEVTPEGDTYSCTVTVNAQPFVERYSEEIGVSHRLTSAATMSVKYTYDKTSGTWNAPVDGEVVATINVACDVVSIAPADITVYMGGDGYEGVVSGTGDDGVTSDGLPTPGYVITLPEWVNDQYFESADQAQNLSGKVRFVLDGNDDGDYTDKDIDRVWELEPYGVNNESTTDSDGIARFVYRMDKDTLSDEPVRLQFTDDAGNKYTSDDFQPNADKLFTEYTMGIYPGAVDQGKVNAQIVIDGEVKETLDAAVTDGTLTVRGTNDETTVTVPVGNDESSVSDNTNVVDEATGTTITAISQEGTSYHINDSQVAVDAGDVSLLADSLLENKEPLETYLQEKNYATAESNIQFQYLDLVQPKNGNAQVTADQPMTIYWKAPKNADLDKDFTLVHFEGLDRDYTGEGVVSDEETHVYSTKQDLIDASSAEKLEKVELDGATYLKFTTQTFSPFALIWEEKESSNPDPGPGPSPTEFVLHYESNGGTPYADESYKANTVVELDKTPSRQGYIFTGWYSDEDLQNKITSVKMTSDKTVYAGWEATDVPGDLNGEDHFAYVFGYEDGNVRPNRNITRAEVASIFFRLLNEDVREENLTADNDFSDVSADAWYNIPVSTMAKMGIVKGRTADEFAPDAPITRAEFAAIASRFDTSDIQPDSTFTDISGHWAEEAIERAATIGWIMGYEDNTFRPENNITRAESMATINRVLKRLPENESDLLDEMHHWPDNQPGSWYYLAVQEATNGHDYERKADGVHEKWTAMREH